MADAPLKRCPHYGRSPGQRSRITSAEVGYELDEQAGNGVVRCLVCGGYGCHSWCPRDTMREDEMAMERNSRIACCLRIIELQEHMGVQKNG